MRGRKPVDLEALEELLVRFSQLVVEQPWIREIDINPLLVSADRILALDARVVVYGPEVKAESLPRSGDSTLSDPAREAMDDEERQRRRSFGRFVRKMNPC